MDKLLELAERCEKAVGPDYALSQAIFSAIEIVPNRADEGYPGYHYTASLDAAMTLVPEGTHGQVQFGNRPGAWIGHEGADAPDFNVARTPALALCAAALRARTIQGSAP